MNKEKFIQSILIPINIIIGSYILFIISTFLMTNIPVYGGSIFKEFAPMWVHISIPMILFLILMPLIIEKAIYKMNFSGLGFVLLGRSKKISFLIFFSFSFLYLVLFVKEQDKLFFLCLSIFLIIQCFGEDILFRSVLQRRLHAYFKPFITIILTSIIFVFVFHKDNLLENFFFRFPLGIVMSFVFYKTRNVFSVTAIHFLNNLYFNL